MIELKVNGEIPLIEVIGKEEEDVEALLHENISIGLSKEIVKHVDEMAFIDMELNEKENKFDFSAELVICSKQDILTANEIMAEKLANLGLNATDIVNVLSTQQESTGGF